MEPEKNDVSQMIKKAGPDILKGILLCGATGYFMAGPDAREISGGIGAALGIAFGLLISNYRKPKE